MVKEDERPAAPEKQGDEREPRELDLTRETGGSGGLESPRTKKYSPKRARERTRTFIASALLGLLGVTILLAFVTLWWAPDKNGAMMELLKMVLPQLITLTGTVLGFYFFLGSQSKKK